MRKNEEATLQGINGEENARENSVASRQCGQTEDTSGEDSKTGCCDIAVTSK
jgi:hypothetical protein